MTNTVPSSATRPNASAAFTSASENPVDAAAGAVCCGAFLAKAAGLGACGFIEAGLGTAGLLALTAGVVACSVVSLMFSDAVTFSSAMASSFK